MIGRKAEKVLNRAVRYALENEQEYFTLEHVLWSLIQDPTIVEVLEACGTEIQLLNAELESYLEREVPKANKSNDPNLTPGASETGEGVEHPVATLSIQRLIQRALFHVQSAGKDEIQPADLLVALFQAKDSHALHLLQKQGVERIDVLNYLSHGLSKDSQSQGEGPNEPSQFGDIPENRISSAGGTDGIKSSGDPLSEFTVNLNERARVGRIDPLVGRQNELERVIQTLCRRRKNNPLLVGEAGVGKTAIAEGLALRIVNGDVPSLLENSVIYALDLGSLIAGTKFRGDFEQRMKRVLASLLAQRDRGRQPILFIDEIHTIIGAGSVSGGMLDAANLLKPVLTRGDIQCIGSTTYTEYRSTFEKDHALARRFQKIDILEPSTEEAVQILNGLKASFESHHGVQYTPDAIRAAVELSAKHLTDRFLPDKAIDVMDEVGAKARLSRRESMKDLGKDLGRDSGKGFVKESMEPVVIDTAAIEHIIAQIARIPARSVNTSQKNRLKNLERDLKLTIFGQDHAISALTTSIRLARSGLRAGDRPVGCFLFCGPTGVGKTELSKQLAHCLGISFHRYDMSEYSERHTISRLIGAPPGYVGFEQAGLLTEAVIKSPHSVVLLDEIEKAHPEIWNILLQVMDHGMLTDNNGRKADFRNAIIIMTSNVGSRDMEKRPLGFGAAAGATTHSAAQKAVETTFSPEFRNRLDAVIYFNSLDSITIGQVVGKQLIELESQLLAKGVEVDIDADVREWLAQKGYDRQMGARPMARLIQDKLKKPLAEEILFGQLESGGRVTVKLAHKENAEPEMSFIFEPKAPPAGERHEHEHEHEQAVQETDREK